MAGDEGSIVPGTHINWAGMSVPAAAALVFMKMGVLLSSLWLVITAFLLFLSKFFAAYVPRVKEGDEVSQEGVAPQNEEYPSISAEGSSFFQHIFHQEGKEQWEEVPVGRNVEEVESSTLEFKFSRQIPDAKSEEDDQVLKTSQFLDDSIQDNAKATTKVNNYRVATDKGFVGFIEVPKSKTFVIHESFVGGHQNEDHQPYDPELVDRELKGRFLSVKGLDQTIKLCSHEEDAHLNEDVQPYHQELLDRELMDRCSSVKGSDEKAQHCDEEAVLLEQEEMETMKQQPQLKKSESVGSNQEELKPSDEEGTKDLVMASSGTEMVKQKPQLKKSESVGSNQDELKPANEEGTHKLMMESSEIETMKQKPQLKKSESVGSNQGELKPDDEEGTKDLMVESSETKVLLEERETVAYHGQTTPESAEAFDWDSSSITSSDGYSVKDFTADYDSDELISDRDLSSHGSENLESRKKFADDYLISDRDISSHGSEDLESEKQLDSDDLISDGDLNSHGSDNLETEEKLEETGKGLDEMLSHEQSISAEKNIGLGVGTEWDEVLSNGDDMDDNASVDFKENIDKQLDESLILESEEEVKRMVQEITKSAATVLEKFRLEHLDLKMQLFMEDGTGIRRIEARFPSSLDFDEEFIDFSMDKVSSFKNESRSLNSSENKFSETPTLGSPGKGETESEQDPVKGYDYSDEPNLKKHEQMDEEEEDELELLWEHQNVIEQLKMELAKAKSFGLPTIQEGSESLKLTEDLKPWKIDIGLKDPIDELNNFYKSYKERMRKLDILNYQKMYSIACLKVKDPLKFIGNKRLTIASIFSEEFWPCRRRKSEGDPSHTFIKELQIDLENVYVGQMCLSWEFLWWQHERAIEMFESDHYNDQRYNQVAGEFQQLQVMMQRFLEDEPFQGSRLSYYVKSRYLQQGLLQVPIVRADSTKDKKADSTSQSSYAVTSEQLKDMMMKIIRLFGQFVISDKEADVPSVMKGLGLGRIHAELLDPADSDLLENIRDSLQKKEKKLKDLIKVGNCLVQKFKKTQHERLDKEMFYSRVDMKLVSRALTMSRISTDQLLWCHNKLTKINFENRTLHREPAFLLFPC